MASIRILQRSFSGGEVTPEFFGRIDDAKYASGLATCRNFIPKPHGPAENRAGFRFVREARYSSLPVRLIPFTFSTTQTVVIEISGRVPGFGLGYFRFHTEGGTLLDGNGQPYEVPHTYRWTELFDIHYVQSADVLTLVHPNHAPRELRRLGATNWELKDIDFAPSVNPPGFVRAIKESGSETKYTYWYVVTTVGADDISESVASAPVSVKANLYETGNTVRVQWGEVAGATRYNVYKLQGGLYGYIGQVDAADHEGGTYPYSIIDDDIDPDMSKTPPRYETVFDGPGKYPAAVSYFEQRRVFAGTTLQPQNIWMTRSGTESNMGYSMPVQADDRISFRVAAREANTIRHAVPLSELLLLTSSAEWRVTSQNDDAVTPTSISVRPQSYIGANNVQPVIINNTLIYCAARGGHVRELAYNWQASGYITGDLSLRAPHLFDNLEIVDMAYSKSPYPIVWCVSSNGKLLGLTYVPEQQVGAWHQHDTDGFFESVTTVAEGHEDVLYAVVRRQINGQWKRYIERMETRQFTDQADAFFVDCGLTYDGPPVSTLSGLDHLEGKTVSILVDGAVHPQRVVENGSISLDVEGSKIHVGLPITADLQTLPVAAPLQDGSFGQGRFKNINKLWLRVHRSSGIWVGPNADQLTEAKQRTTEPYGSPPRLKSEEISIMVSPSWGDSGQVFIRQADPLPLTVVGLTMEIALGG